MQLRVRAAEITLTPAERLSLERRLRLGVGRMASAVSMADVAISRTAGPAGASNWVRCRITARLRQGGGLEISDEGESLTDAVSTATWRLSHRLERLRVVTLEHLESRGEALGSVGLTSRGRRA